MAFLRRQALQQVYFLQAFSFSLIVLPYERMEYQIQQIRLNALLGVLQRWPQEMVGMMRNCVACIEGSEVGAGLAPHEGGSRTSGTRSMTGASRRRSGGRGRMSGRMAGTGFRMPGTAASTGAGISTCRWECCEHRAACYGRQILDHLNRPSSIGTGSC